ncbi:MAG: fumarylacetoacetate hydrolase family protein [Rudaea sp.]|uniref:fumarylacetoacetate hydrolase family protein n=1 Tax=unclassified Rudaea TaxID=2627037 RepID=UPI0010F7EAB8|nr:MULTISPECIES: fumarylacetoacetate hydrolase family protein [unclassified Rudaea]MBN8885718.1 fumarylacetoacetate hydrolase family protein [Rudaea sp.]MBR0343646.1 fumarylacetoacetate hydrolase family protein [Rudaea sp.]
MNLAVPAAPAVTVPVAGTNQAFPVRRIYCVGRNYAAHAREMGFDPDREPPFFFCKPADAIVYVAPGSTGTFPYPTETKNCHYEMELVAAIGKGGSDIAVENALDHVYGYALGLDMTRRDLQIKMREMGRPWDIGKAFDHSAPIGPIHRASEVGHLAKGAIWLRLNGESKQKADLSDLIWSVAETVAYLSKFFALVPGDLIYTGTPEGVGAVVKGDKIQGGIDGLGEFDVAVV